MTKLKISTILMMGAVLAACGGGSSGGGSSSEGASSSAGGNTSSQGSSSSCGLLGCGDNTDIVTQLTITNETLPFRETFDVGSAGENRANYFLTAAYKPLNSENPQTLPDGTEHNDEHPSFYYPTCCFWEVEEGTTNRTGELIGDLDERLFVGQGFMAVHNARFTIGQLLPDIVSAEDSRSDDAKSDTTDAPVSSSWGELDLSQPYRLSFCVKDSGVAGTGSGDLDIFIDNNTGGRQGESIWGVQSRLLRTTAANLTAGQRLVLDVPGAARQINADGEEGTVLSTIGDDPHIGSENSFIQLRVSNGGYLVYSDLIIENQADSYTYDICEADDELFNPPLIEGVGFNATLPLTVNFALGKDRLFGLNSNNQFPAFADSLTEKFFKIPSGTGRVFVEDGKIRFGNARWTIGQRGGNTASGDVVEELDNGLDLSEPYRIILTIDSLTGNSPANADLRVFVDNSTNTAADSAHGSASEILTIRQSLLEAGELIINVPGDVTMNGNVIGDPIVHIGTEKSFISLICPGNCGNADADPSFGITLSGVQIRYQDEEPDTGPSVSDDKTWNFDVASYSAYTSVENFLAGEASGNRNVSQANPAKSVNGLLFFKTDTGGSIRFRDGSGIINFNGSSFSNNATLIETDGEGLLAGTLRNYVGVPVVAGKEVTVSFTWSQTASTVNPSKVGLIDDLGKLLDEEDASDGNDGVISFTLPESHAATEVRFFYSRENNTSNDGSPTGGINLTGAERTYAQP